MQINCGGCSSLFDFEEADKQLLHRISPQVGARVYDIPAPKLCPACQHRRRLSFYNERTLYRRRCDAGGEDIISVYSPRCKMPVYSSPAWWGDSWDALSFGREIDLKRSFFEQLAELRQVVPAQALKVVNCENCDYNNALANSRNCYLVFGGSDCEDAYYCHDSISLKDCVDVWWSKNIQLSAHVFSSAGLYDCWYCARCANSSGLWFCRDCIGCSDCLGCSSLSNKQFHIFNVAYPKEDYQRFMAQLNRGSWKQIQKLLKQSSDHFDGQPQRGCVVDFSENCSGDMICDSRNCVGCFTVTECEDSRFLLECGRLRDSYGLARVYDSEGLVYDSMSADHVFRAAFLLQCSGCSDTYYCMECVNLKNSFGCVGLRDREYCILNRQYSRTEYYKVLEPLLEAMKKRGEWGEFFPARLSPFGYNETLAETVFALDEKAARKAGFNWSGTDKPSPRLGEITPASRLPDNIDDVKDSIVDAPILCELSGEPFRITSAELAFYRRHKVPVPRRHPDQRYRDMLGLRNPVGLAERTCGRCGASIWAAFQPKRPELLYCDDCFSVLLQEGVPA